jgi:anti-anti-sigma regulatory factor
MLDPQLIIGAILFPLFVAYLIYVKNKYLKNDSEYLLLSFLLGCVIFIPVLVVQLSFNFLQPNDFVKYFFQAALVEEGFKFIILYRFKNLIIDLAHIDSIDSTMVSLLLTLRRLVEYISGCDMYVIHANKRIVKIFNLLAVSEYFNIGKYENL